MKKILFLILISQVSYAMEVHHFIAPGSSFFNTALNRACSTFSGDRDSLTCNPAIFPLQNSPGLQVNMVGKADGNSIDNGKKLIFDPVSEDLIRKLFRENTYNSFSFSSNLRFLTPYFELTYSPYYLLADILIYNPAFPEISLLLTNRSSLRTTSGYLLSDADSGVVSSIGYTLNYFSQTYSKSKFTLFDLSYKKPEDLITFQKKVGITADLGGYIELKNLFGIKIAPQIKNIGTPFKNDESRENSATQLENKYTFEAYGQLGIGKNFETKMGGFDLNLEFFSEKYFNSWDLDRTVLGGRYTIGLFSVLASISKYDSSIGMHFLSQNFDVGLSYTKEKDIGPFQINSDDSVYLGIDINI